ncbi:MAG: phosphatidate cytidylyltransferase [Caldilineaceae bacterium]|nr:phosphatidate cytidylyltransferase [Caldilineaceae bacterium]
MNTRIVVGLIALPIITIPIWLGGYLYGATVLLIALIGGYEFYELLSVGRYRPSPIIGLVWLAALTLCAVQPGMPLLSTVLAGGLILTFVYAFFQHDQPINTWVSTSIGAIYLGVMMGQVLALRFLPGGVWWLTFGLLVTWMNDTAAYFVGSTLGRHKIWPRLSPKKTWEGTVSGWLGAALMGGIVVTFVPLPLTLSGGMLLAFFVGILGLMGDLSISVIKGQVGVKDSGRFFPGHGGMLDRLDSSLFTLPFIYQVALWITSSLS